MGRFRSLSLSRLGAAALVSFTLSISAPCAWSEAGGTAVVYTSVDEILSSKIFRAIEEKTGLDVRPVYDSEATKTTGLYLRILEERSRPRADVFWNSEFSRTLLLMEQGLLAPHTSAITETIPDRFRDPAGRWTAFSVRARVLAFNTDLVAESEAPRTLDQLLAPKWKNRVLWANPMFGTTATHCGALLASMGEPAFAGWLDRWKGQVRQVSGNGQVAKLVARGVAPLGLTDTDDVFRLRDSPIDAVPFDSEGKGTLLIPNTVAVLEGAPHPEAARAFVDALLDPEIERLLAFSTSRQLPVRKEVEIPNDLEPWKDIPALEIGLEEVAQNVDRALEITRAKLAQ